MSPGDMTPVKCSECQFVFQARRESIADGSDEMPWMIRATSGQVLTFRGFSTLHQWILQGKVSEEAVISRTGDVWKKLGEIDALKKLFTAARAGQDVPLPKSTPSLTAAFRRASGDNLRVGDSLVKGRAHKASSTGPLPVAKQGEAVQANSANNHPVGLTSNAQSKPVSDVQQSPDRDVAADLQSSNPPSGKTEPNKTKKRTTRERLVKAGDTSGPRKQRSENVSGSVGRKQRATGRSLREDPAFIGSSRESSSDFSKKNGLEFDSSTANPEITGSIDTFANLSEKVLDDRTGAHATIRPTRQKKKISVGLWALLAGGILIAFIFFLYGGSSSDSSGVLRSDAFLSGERQRASYRDLTFSEAFSFYKTVSGSADEMRLVEALTYLRWSRHLKSRSQLIGYLIKIETEIAALLQYKDDRGAVLSDEAYSRMIDAQKSSSADCSSKGETRGSFDYCTFFDREYDALSKQTVAQRVFAINAWTSDASLLRDRLDKESAKKRSLAIVLISPSGSSNSSQGTQLDQALPEEVLQDLERSALGVIIRAELAGQRGDIDAGIGFLHSVPDASYWYLDRLLVEGILLAKRGGFQEADRVFRSGFELSSSRKVSRMDFLGESLFSAVVAGKWESFRALIGFMNEYSMQNAGVSASEHPFAVGASTTKTGFWELLFSVYTRQNEHIALKQLVDERATLVVVDDAVTDLASKNSAAAVEPGADAVPSLDSGSVDSKTKAGVNVSTSRAVPSRRRNSLASAARHRSDRASQLAAARAYLRRGKTLKAVAVYDSLLKKNSADVDVINGLAQCELSLHHYSKAKSLYIKALSLQGSSFAAAYGAAESARRLGDRRGAIMYYKKVLAMRPGSSQANRAQSYLSTHTASSERQATSQGSNGQSKGKSPENSNGADSASSNSLNKLPTPKKPSDVVSPEPLPDSF